MGKATPRIMFCNSSIFTESLANLQELNVLLADFVASIVQFHDEFHMLGLRMHLRVWGPR
jgi:hypothetical protein